MENQLSKSDKLKIQIRKEFLQFARKKIEDIQPGDMCIEEYKVFRQELSDIIDFLANKDKYIEAMEFYKTKKNENVNKYFKER